jgi:hypothetical protein
MTQDVAEFGCVKNLRPIIPDNDFVLRVSAMNCTEAE